MNAQEIIKKEGFDKAETKEDAKAMLTLLDNKYPDQKTEIVKHVIMNKLEEVAKRKGIPLPANALAGLLENNDEGKSARREMLNMTEACIRIISGMNKGYKVLGRNPMINDTSGYPDMSREESDRLVKEDMAMGLKLYNACAEYARIYNKVKLEEKDENA